MGRGVRSAPAKFTLSNILRGLFRVNGVAVLPWLCLAWEVKIAHAIYSGVKFAYASFTPESIWGEYFSPVTPEFFRTEDLTATTFDS